MDRLHPSTVDRRHLIRCNVDLPATIEMNCRPRVRCSVTDISLAGAMLKIDRKIYLTCRFILLIDGGADIECRLKHRLLDRAGVAFMVPFTVLP